MRSRPERTDPDGGSVLTREAFARAALPHLDAAYALARWLVRDPTLAEDVVQDAMLRALTYFGSFRGDNPRAWLLQVVRNTAYTRLKRGRAVSEESLNADIPAHDVPDPASDPETVLATQERMSVLKLAVEALPIELREVVILRELEEMSYRDIARITEVPVGTVMSRLFRARQALLRVGASAMRETAT